ncbi:hypothetical protein DERF_003337 [Dermatophagoides farinae]|uniref:Uncharacterized protein n=1 Tax=Dermatophagoides farinae TaxID=6954 RepID=A0A922LCH6_DERFA|nr:hypothetical protein DERF_003337 [Dermatophagoides farinae]
MECTVNKPKENLLSRLAFSLKTESISIKSSNVRFPVPSCENTLQILSLNGFSFNSAILIIFSIGIDMNSDTTPIMLSLHLPPVNSLCLKDCSSSSSFIDKLPILIDWYIIFYHESCIGHSTLTTI